jgi:hypothetical protein
MDAVYALPLFSARSARRLAGLAVCWLVATGCDLGLEESSNRYEQLGKATQELALILRQVTDEASAKEKQPEIQALGDKIRKAQEGIFTAESDNPMGMAKATNVRQAQLFYQVAAGVVRNLERINEADPKAGAMVNEALKGIVWQ